MVEKERERERENGNGKKVREEAAEEGEEEESSVIEKERERAKLNLKIEWRRRKFAGKMVISERGHLAENGHTHTHRTMAGKRMEMMVVVVKERARDSNNKQQFH